MSQHIPWFNPRQIDDRVVAALATGREDLLAEISQDVMRRLDHPGARRHWLVTGPRGAGKSFFLRRLQAQLNQAHETRLRFVLLPEELPNIYAPHELLAEIQRLLLAQANGAVAQWRVREPGASWDEALGELLGSFAQPLLVVGIENIDQLIARAFASDLDSSRLRHLLSEQPCLQIIASAVEGSFDETYHSRLFRQFEHRQLPPWDSQQHRDYLSRRARHMHRNLSAVQLNRIDAYSRFTSGNPRAAAILAASILDQEDPLRAAQDLDAAIETMSDYYRALIERIPANTRKLFDALLRGGEPASQSEIAKRTGAQQSEISRAFIWLVDNGYLVQSREPGEKAKSYRASDRLLVQFYRMRYLQPGERSQLAILADLLADTLSFADAQAQIYAELKTGKAPRTITQHCRAVADVTAAKGVAAGFSLGKELLEAIAASDLPAEAVLRYLCIGMVEMAVPLNLLRDLLDEWPRLWPAQAHANLAKLRLIVLGWIDDLQASPSERAQQRKKLDPDWVTTFSGLAAALSPKTRQRLGYLPAQSGETSAA